MPEPKAAGSPGTVQEYPDSAVADHSGGSPRTVFLLSPAHCGGRRAAVLTRPEASFDLAVRLRTGGAPLGEVFAFLSGLYFRGKLAYTEAFSRPSAETPGALVITAGDGLVPPATIISLGDVERFAAVPIDLRNRGYMDPLTRDLTVLADALPSAGRVVLLGSVATPKYVAPLLRHLGRRVLVPGSFVGMGDMARGALMLRAARQGVELEYVHPADVPLTTTGGSRRAIPTHSAAD